jgi:hypothetical protein
VIGDKGVPKAYPILGRIGNGLLFCGGIAAVVGYVFCIFAPNKKGTLPLAITTLALAGVNVIFSLICRIIAMFSQSMAGGREVAFPGFAFTSESIGGAFALSLVVMLFFFAELILFPVFMWAASHAAKARWAAGGWMIYVIFAAVTAGLCILHLIMYLVAWNNVLNSFREGKTPSKALFIVSSVISLIYALAFLGLMIWYLILLFRTRVALDE